MHNRHPVTEGYSAIHGCHATSRAARHTAVRQDAVHGGAESGRRRPAFAREERRGRGLRRGGLPPCVVPSADNHDGIRVHPMYAPHALRPFSQHFTTDSLSCYRVHMASHPRVKFPGALYHVTCRMGGEVSSPVAHPGTRWHS